MSRHVPTKWFLRRAALGLVLVLVLLAAAAPAPNFLVRAFSSTSAQNQKPAYQAAIPLPIELLASQTPVSSNPYLNR